MDQKEPSKATMNTKVKILFRDSSTTINAGSWVFFFRFSDKTGFDAQWLNFRMVDKTRGGRQKLEKKMVLSSDLRFIQRFVLEQNRLYYYKTPKVCSKNIHFLGRCATRFHPTGTLQITHCRKQKKLCGDLWSILGTDLSNSSVEPFSRYHPSFFITAETPEELESWITSLNLNVIRQSH